MVHCDITFLIVFILTHPVNFPCGRKPGHPEKPHDFRQSVDRLFSHESVARIQPTISEVKDACSDDCDVPTTVPSTVHAPTRLYHRLCMHQHDCANVIKQDVSVRESIISHFKITLL